MKIYISTLSVNLFLPMAIQKVTESNKILWNEDDRGYLSSDESKTILNGHFEFYYDEDSSKSIGEFERLKSRGSFLNGRAEGFWQHYHKNKIMSGRRFFKDGESIEGYGAFYKQDGTLDTYDNQ